MLKFQKWEISYFRKELDGQPMVEGRSKGRSKGRSHSGTDAMVLYLSIPPQLGKTGSRALQSADNANELPLTQLDLLCQVL